jgi:hypothetical protein
LTRQINANSLYFQFIAWANVGHNSIQLLGQIWMQFNNLDLVAFNNRDMTLIKKIHADNVKVYNPDGTVTEPMAPHAEELQFLFDTFDFKVAEHIVGFGFGEWTAGISISEGKWVKPITPPDGIVLQPTGKKVSVKIATIARWENGRIAEEYLFSDNADWNRQIGLQ